MCMRVGLPEQNQYEYTLFRPEAVHMAIASKQLTTGMYDPSKVDGNTTIAMVPKKVGAALGTNQGDEGWGLHAVQGWSLVRIVLWMCVFNSIGTVFVVLWLVLIDSKDLQNAFTPATFLAMMLSLALGIPQYLDAA